MNSESFEYDLDPDELERDVRHGGHDAGERDDERQRARPESAAHEVGSRHISIRMRDGPQSWKHQEHQRIDHDRVRHRKEAAGSCAEHQGGHGDEGVRGVEIAAQKEPHDKAAEAPSTQSPLADLR